MSRVSTTSQLKNQVRLLTSQQNQLQNLATQLSTQKKTQVNSGLGSDLMTSIRTRASLKSTTAFQQNITNADLKMQLMLQATEEIKAQTENLSGQMILFSQESTHQKGDLVSYDNPLTPDVENTYLGMTSDQIDVDFQTMQDLAGNLYDIVSDLLNIQDADSYLLNGADASTKPLNDNGLLDSAITNLIQQWKDGSISNAELITDLTNGDTSTNPDAINDSIIGFSANLSADNVGNVSVRASETTELDYTVKANEDPFRNILVSLAFLKNESLGPIADTYTPPNAPPNAPDVQGAPGVTVDEQKENFFKVFSAVQEMVVDSIDGVSSVNGRVETVRARIDQINDSHIQSKAIMSDVVSDIEDVDMEQVAVEISVLQTQLQASYTVTSRVQQLTLVNFI